MLKTRHSSTQMNQELPPYSTRLAKASKKLFSKFEPKRSVNMVKLRLLTYFHAYKLELGDNKPERWMVKLKDLYHHLTTSMVGASMREELFASEGLSQLPLVSSKVVYIFGRRSR